MTPMMTSFLHQVGGLGVLLESSCPCSFNVKLCLNDLVKTIFVAGMQRARASQQIGQMISLSR